MVPRNITRMRNIAATLLTLSGISHIATLWFRDIDGTTLAGALMGSLYLIIGIGLYGQSRFALFMAIVVPGTGAWLAINNGPMDALGLPGTMQLGTAFLVILLSAVVLTAVRNNPSV